MKTLLFLLLAAAAAFAESADGDLYAIDPKVPSVTLSDKGKLQIYRVRPDTEITINGVRGKFADLNTSMTAKVVSGEPQVASKIVANGTPGAAGAGAAVADKAAPGGPATDANADFERRLVGTKWNWAGYHFTFEADGRSSGDRNFSWKTVKASTIAYEYKDGYHGTIVFEHGLTRAKVDEITPAGGKATPSLTRDKP